MSKYSKAKEWFDKNMRIFAEYLDVLVGSTDK
jgi:hypothetical protein